MKEGEREGRMQEKKKKQGIPSITALLPGLQANSTQSGEIKHSKSSELIQSIQH